MSYFEYYREMTEQDNLAKTIESIIALRLIQDGRVKMEEKMLKEGRAKLANSLRAITNGEVLRNLTLEERNYMKGPKLRSESSLASFVEIQLRLIQGKRKREKENKNSAVAHCKENSTSKHTVHKNQPKAARAVEEQTPAAEGTPAMETSHDGHPVSKEEEAVLIRLSAEPRAEDETEVIETAI